MAESELYKKGNEVRSKLTDKFGVGWMVVGPLEGANG